MRKLFQQTFDAQLSVMNISESMSRDGSTVVSIITKTKLLDFVTIYFQKYIWRYNNFFFNNRFPNILITLTVFIELFTKNVLK